MSSKKINRAPKYIDVKFGDNDFGLAMELALKRLWVYVNKNNGHIVGSFTKTTIPQMFESLHHAGVLEPMVKRLFVLEHLCGDVEFLTRGLYWEKVKWGEKKIDKQLGFKSLDDYLSCDVSFHSNKKFMRKWQNGEHAWLNLNNGSADTF